MKLALWQADPGSGHWPETFARLAVTARAARLAGAELLLCPELLLSSYNDPAAIRRLAQPPDGPENRQIDALAAELGLAIAYGYPEAAPGGAIYNSARLVGADGRICLNHRKIHLFGDQERGVFTPGDTVTPPIVWGGFRIGLLVCFDIEFPESARQLALLGADLLLVPTALPAGDDQVPTLLIPARAAENGLFVAYANYHGTQNGLAFAGLSCVAGPDGTKSAACGPGPALCIVDLDQTAIAQARQTVNYLHARRLGLPSPLPS